MLLAFPTKLYAKEILIKLDTVDLDQSARIMRKGQISILDNSIGALYHSLKDFDQAIRYYTEAYELLLELDDHTSAGVVMGNIGEMYMKSHDFDRALEYLHTSLKLKEAGGAPTRSIASTVFNIARVHKRMGRQDTAMVEFNQALEVFRKENHLAGLMETYAIHVLHKFPPGWIDGNLCRTWIALSGFEPAYRCITGLSNRTTTRHGIISYRISVQSV